MARTDRKRKVPWGRSGNRSAIGKNELVVDATPDDDESVIHADECHIISSRLAGPRSQREYRLVLYDQKPKRSADPRR